MISQNKNINEIFNEKLTELNDSLKLNFMFDNLFLYNDYEENKTQEKYDILKNNLEGKNCEVTVINTNFECCNKEMVYDSIDCNHSCSQCGKMVEFLDLQMTYHDKINNIKPPQYKYNRNKHFLKLINNYPKNIQNNIMEKFNDISTSFNKINKEENKVRNLPCFNFLLFKILEILELKEYLTNYKLKKSREKLKELDSDFRVICKMNGWAFLLTI